MGFSKTPYEVQREQQERAIRAQEEQQARQIAAQAWNSFANMDVGGEAIKPLNLPIDWQHGADIGAKRAAGLELQNLEGQQKLAQIAAQGEQRRAETAMELALKAKYAPKKYPGGPGPVAKLAKELWDVHQSVPEDEQQAERKNQRKTAIIQQLSRLGPSGRAEVENFNYAVSNPYAYQYGKGTKRGGQLELLDEKDKGKERGGYDPKGDIALIRLKTENEFGQPIPENKKAQLEAMDRLSKWAESMNQPQGQTSTDRANDVAPKATMPKPSSQDSDWVKLPSGRMYNPKTGESK